jgi:hypothetical protein
MLFLEARASSVKKPGMDIGLRVPITDISVDNITWHAEMLIRAIHRADAFVSSSDIQFEMQGWKV